MGPLISTPLIPLLQRSYDRLEFLNISTSLLHDRAFYDITHVPPSHLRNLTLSGYLPPPMQSAVKPVFHHVVTLGIRSVSVIRSEKKAEWVRFLSDPTYTPHLRCVLTDAKKYQLEVSCLSYSGDVLRAFEEVLEDRGVALKGMMDDYSSFPIKLLQKSTLLRSEYSLLIISLLEAHLPIPRQQ